MSYYIELAGDWQVGLSTKCGYATYYQPMKTSGVWHNGLPPSPQGWHSAILKHQAYALWIYLSPTPMMMQCDIQMPDTCHNGLTSPPPLRWHSVVRSGICNDNGLHFQSSLYPNIIGHSNRVKHLDNKQSLGSIVLPGPFYMLLSNWVVICTRYVTALWWSI